MVLRCSFLACVPYCEPDLLDFQVACGQPEFDCTAILLALRWAFHLPVIVHVRAVGRFAAEGYPIARLRFFTGAWADNYIY
jgi:hypothetical protein